MIQTKYGDLLEAKGVIVHGCNAQGVMGSGVALQIKNKWPESFRDYKLKLIHQHTRGNLLTGCNAYSEVEDDVLLVHMITQEFYGRDKSVVYVDYTAVKKCFRDLNELLQMNIPKINNIKNLGINFPLIGCGLANGDWNVVSRIIDEELDDSLEKILWVKENV